MSKKYELEFYTKTGTSDPIDTQEDLNHALFAQTGVEQQGQDQTFYVSDDQIIFVNSYEDEIEFPPEDTLIPEAVAIVKAEIEAEEKELYRILHYRTPTQYIYCGLTRCNEEGLKEVARQVHKMNELFNNPNKILHISKGFESIKQVSNYLQNLGLPVEDLQKLETEPLYVAALIEEKL